MAFLTLMDKLMQHIPKGTCLLSSIESFLEIFPLNPVLGERKSRITWWMWALAWEKLISTPGCLNNVCDFE